MSNFYGSGFGAGIGLWIAASSLFVATHVLLWTARPGRGRVMRYGIAAVVLSVPPIGLVGWAPPITASGFLFPGWSWIGLAAAATLLLAMTTRMWPAATVVLTGFWLLSALSWTAPMAPQGWVGIDTRFSGSNGQYADYWQHQATINRVLVEATADCGGHVRFAGYGASDRGCRFWRCRGALSFGAS